TPSLTPCPENYQFTIRWKSGWVALARPIRTLRRNRVALYALQFLPYSFEFARDSGDGSWHKQSRLELGRSDWFAWLLRRETANENKPPIPKPRHCALVVPLLCGLPRF